MLLCLRLEIVLCGLWIPRAMDAWPKVSAGLVLASITWIGGHDFRTMRSCPCYIINALSVFSFSYPLDFWVFDFMRLACFPIALCLASCPARNIPPHFRAVNAWARIGFFIYRVSHYHPPSTSAAVTPIGCLTRLLNTSMILMPEGSFFVANCGTFSIVQNVGCSSLMRRANSKGRK